MTRRFCGLAVAIAMLGVVAPANASVSTRSEATALYKQVKQAEKVPAGWTGSVETCEVGTESQASIDATIGAVNIYRRFAGVKPVTANPEFNQDALAAAVAMQAAGGLEHDLGPGAPCYSEDAAMGASHSNLAGASGASAIGLYMGEEGLGGHRRFVLFPGQIEVGTGSTGSYSALYVIGGELDGSRVVEVPPNNLVAYPSPGFFPAPWTRDMSWTASLGNYDTQDAFDASRAKVKLKIDGKKAGVKNVTDHENGVGMGRGISWELKKPSVLLKGGDHKVKVRITGVTLDGKPHPVAYTVKAFDPKKSK
jgi:hypothetical protein